MDSGQLLTLYFTLSQIFQVEKHRLTYIQRLNYEGCSNMKASSFITFVTYMLRQNGLRFYKGLYVILQLAPDLKKNTVYLLNYNCFNEGNFIILTNSMLRTYQ